MNLEGWFKANRSWKRPLQLIVLRARQQATIIIHYYLTHTHTHWNIQTWRERARRMPAKTQLRFAERKREENWKRKMKWKNKKQNWRLSSWCHLCRSITSAEEGEGEQLGDAGVNHAPIGNLISAPRLGHRLIYSGLFYYLFIYFFFFFGFLPEISARSLFTN